MSDATRRVSRTGPPVPRIPVLGTTWYRRGPGYWIRRAGASAAVFVMLAAFGVYVGGVYAAIATTSGSTRAILTIVATSSVVLSFVMAVRAQRRPHTPLDRGAATRAGSSGARLGVMSSGGSVAGVAVLIVGALLGIGWFVVFFAMTFRRHLGPAEIAAVEGVERWKTHHPGWSPTRRNGS
jgi:hypothetical protein